MPYPLFFFVFPWPSSSSSEPTFMLSFLYRILLLGVLGSVAQVCGYKGIEYSSATLASAISNLTPAFTFILALMFRKYT
ncbi:hypothetical protein CMV_009897 [Castanea mollissima]|uniref:WAT1-related protein n=1 Tax=Castanea mollissima TaxID=60419 RepID=A0A8J4RNP9_9ROSI|nr:hypothetical protein CMV_009897 [Castanea mollissima]